MLEVPDIFAHADEQVYARVLHLVWKHKDEYANIIPLMAGFHQLRVFQKLLFKRHHCKGYRDWFVDAGIIAGGSTNQAIEGRHYFRSMRLHKEGFCALVQSRVEDLTCNYKSIDQELIEQLVTL